MPKFSDKSKKILQTCHIDLQGLFNEVIRTYDCTILEGHRDEETQNIYHRQGKSKLSWPESAHNKNPSLAVDVAPYPIDWNDSVRFYHFAGFVLGIATKRGIKIRWGGDWNGNMDFKDQNFHDLPHIELKD